MTLIGGRGYDRGLVDQSSIISVMNRYPALPPLSDRIRRLEEFAVDLWWSWHPEGRAVFRRLDYGAWRATAHNPVRMLSVIPRERLEAAANDPDFLVLYDRAIARLDEATAPHSTWWSRNLAQA